MTTRKETPAGLLRRSVLSLLGTALLLAVIMFVSAGIGWQTGWVFLFVFLISTILSAAYLWRKNPDVFVARSKIHQGTRWWDKILLAILLPSFFAIFATAGFDARYGWSSVPAWLMLIGYALFVLGFVLSTWVYAVNKYAEPSVRMQPERQHKVIDTGPYAIVRHPLYAFSFFLVVGIPLALRSYWALVPVAIGAIAIIVRTVLEDRMLRNELEGYEDYASRVRYRLVPGVW
jgi:protein-S-isoprenylcysteine O-methyltransferase Ste14